MKGEESRVKVGVRVPRRTESHGVEGAPFSALIRCGSSNTKFNDLAWAATRDEL